MTAVFLSYARDDVWIMRAIRADLQARGFQVWVDENLVPGERSWKDKIESVIVECACVVAILSGNAKHSPWVDRELEYAELCEKPIIPVLARDEAQQAIPIELVSAHRIDIRTNYPENIDRLIAAISRYTQPEEPGLNVLDPTSTRWDRTGSLFWINYDLGFLISSIRNGSLASILRGARQIHHHLTRLQLGEDIVERARLLKVEIEDLSSEDLTSELRNRLSTQAELLLDTVRILILQHDPDWEPNAPEYRT